MEDGRAEYVANPVLARALDILFILHADHEQNCSTNIMRSVGSAHAILTWPPPPPPQRSQDLCMAEPTKKCCRMLDEIGSKEQRPWLC